MKKIALLGISLFATGVMLMAQGGPGRNGRANMNAKEHAERMTERMVKEYALNDTQKQQVYEANLMMLNEMQPSQRPGVRKGHGVHNKKADGNCPCDTAKVTKNVKKDNKAASKDKKREAQKEQMEKMRAERQKAHDEYDVKIKNIFTKEQYAAYTKNRAERQKRMSERPRTNN